MAGVRFLQSYLEKQLRFKLRSLKKNTESGGKAVRLTKTTIRGFRSIKDEITIVFDPRITVILGANDHGKSNILDALQQLNRDTQFDPDRDLNWDLYGQDADFPFIQFEFDLDGDEQREVKHAVHRAAITSQLVARYEECRAKLDAFSELNVPAQAAESDTEDGETTEMGGAPSEREVTQAATELVTIAASLLAVDVHFDGQIGASTEEILTRANYYLKRYTDLSNQIAQQKHTVADLKAKLANYTTANDKQNVLKVSTALDQANQFLSALNQQAERIRYLHSAAETLTAVDSEAFSFKEIEDFTLPNIPATVSLSKQGLKGTLKVHQTPDIASLGFGDIIEDLLPRVEIIRLTQNINDGVSAEDIEKPEYEFMRGIFYYAGLQRSEWKGVFEQSNRTQRRLRDASAKLNETLSKNWSQGSSLQFMLVHDSSKKSIVLSIQDPSVSARDVQASQRSTGFTNFFSLKTILNARRNEADAASYIWLFDEPGIYLHPYGQHDLLQVFESLADANQIAYCTHSIFMLNKNFPHRHRLIIKTEKGTKVDQKPYTGQWSSAISSLGLGLPGTILFANRIVFVEGDSDPILLNALFQKAISLNLIKADTNQLSFISTGDSKNADALLRFFSESALRPRMAAIFDGDDGGVSRKKKLDAQLKKLKCETLVLENKAVLEDIVFSASRLLPEATVRYAAKISGKKASEADVKAALDKKKGRTWADWTRQEGAIFAGLDEKEGLSPIGIAREYVELLEAANAEDIQGAPEYEPAMALLTWIVEKLDLPSLTASEEKILADT